MANITKDMVDGWGKEAAEALLQHNIPLNDTLTKIAKDNNLNIDQMARLVESSNIAMHTSVYKGNAYPEFDVASLPVIAKESQVAPVEKTASDYDYSPRSFGGALMKMAMFNDPTTSSKTKDNSRELQIRHEEKLAELAIDVYAAVEDLRNEVMQMVLNPDTTEGALTFVKVAAHKVTPEEMLPAIRPVLQDIENTVRTKCPLKYKTASIIDVDESLTLNRNHPIVEKLANYYTTLNAYLEKKGAKVPFVGRLGQGARTLVRSSSNRAALAQEIAARTSKGGAAFGVAGSAVGHANPIMAGAGQRIGGTTRELRRATQRAESATVRAKVNTLQMPARPKGAPIPKKGKPAPAQTTVAPTTSAPTNAPITAQAKPAPAQTTVAPTTSAPTNAPITAQAKSAPAPGNWAPPPISGKPNASSPPAWVPNSNLNGRPAMSSTKTTVKKTPSGTNPFQGPTKFDLTPGPTPAPKYSKARQAAANLRYMGFKASDKASEIKGKASKAVQAISNKMNDAGWKVRLGVSNRVNNAITAAKGKINRATDAASNAGWNARLTTARVTNSALTSVKNKAIAGKNYVRDKLTKVLKAKKTTKGRTKKTVTPPEGESKGMGLRLGVGLAAGAAGTTGIVGYRSGRNDAYNSMGAMRDVPQNYKR